MGFQHMTKNYNTTLEFILVFTLLNFYVFIISGEFPRNITKILDATHKEMGVTVNGL